MTKPELEPKSVFGQSSFPAPSHPPDLFQLLAESQVTVLIGLEAQTG